jgi:hypothetical protein
MHTISIDRYSFQKVWQRQYHLSILAPSLAFVSSVPGNAARLGP